MSKWFEVVVTSQHVYTVKADTEDEAMDAAWESAGPSSAVEAKCKELATEEELDRSFRHSDYVIET